MTVVHTQFSRSSFQSDSEGQPSDNSPQAYELTDSPVNKLLETTQAGWFVYRHSTTTVPVQHTFCSPVLSSGPRWLCAAVVPAKWSVHHIRVIILIVFWCNEQRHYESRPDMVPHLHFSFSQFNTWKRPVLICASQFSFVSFQQKQKKWELTNKKIR